MPSSFPPSSVPPIQPGEVLAGKYRVERVLGAGGMGVVVAATHLELEQPVAVKFLLGQIASTEAVMRFVREARAAAKIKSEHVARVIDVGRLDDNSPYMVMEYLDGRDLAARLGSGPLSVEDAVDFVIQACDAMAEAHAEGIVHRDLKPANLFLTRRSDGSPLIKVLDFGISKLATPEAGDLSLTRTSAVMGSPMYMSPEQARASRTVDQRTDIWALGVILFELLTNRAPFRGQTLPELVSAIALDPPEPLRNVRADVPVELEAAVLRCLKKDREQRFQSVGELVAALAVVAPRRSQPICERVLKISGMDQASVTMQSLHGEASQVTSAEAGSGTATAWSELQRGATRRMSRKWFLLAPAAVLVTVVAFVLLRHPSNPQPQTAASSEQPASTPSAAMLASSPPTQPPAPNEMTSAAAPAASASAVAPPSASSAALVRSPAPAAVSRAKPRSAAGSPVRATTPAASAPAPVAASSSAPAKPAASAATPARRRGLDIDLK